MIIGVCGFGYTGSGAIIDLLKEVDGCRVYDESEYILSYCPDGLEDLEYHLIEQSSRFFSSNMAIKRFKELTMKLASTRYSIYNKYANNHFVDESNEYIESLTQLTWNGTWMLDPIFDKNQIHRTIKYRIGRRLAKIFPSLYKFTLSKMFFSISPELFYEKTNNYLYRVLDYSPEQILVLNQPFPANAPLKSMRYFGESSKAIIVDRDPRDVYVLIKEHLNVGWIPTDSVENFVEYFKRLLCNRIRDPRILYVHFEDLIYNYEETVNMIFSFLNVSLHAHIYGRQYFDPSISINNTQIYLRLDKYKEDIKYIESNLSERLYCFPSTDRKMIDPGIVF